VEPVVTESGRDRHGGEFDRVTPAKSHYKADNGRCRDELEENNTSSEILSTQQ
jgi:hypothetical protein